MNPNDDYATGDYEVTRADILNAVQDFNEWNSYDLEAEADFKRGTWEIGVFRNPGRDEVQVARFEESIGALQDWELLLSAADPEDAEAEIERSRSALENRKVFNA